MKTISEFLIENKENKSISFHMPGHKGRVDIFRKAGFGDFFQDMLKEDITKIPGADTLISPKNSIKEVMENYANLYGVKHTELLVNGSSVGIMAAILANVSRGGKLIMARNSHRSAFSALKMAEIEPIYIAPSIDREFEIASAISPIEVKMACENNPDAEAVLITSPNLYGIVSDVQRIADIAHSYGKILIVDQAHGAHLKFFDAVTGTKTTAEDSGADIVVNSIHKTLLSLTGTAILNICSDRVSIEDVSEQLRMLHTTSPNYLMIGSLDINEKIIRRWGTDMVVAWMKDLNYLYSRLEAINGVTIVEVPALDKTKVCISLADLGVTGKYLYKQLRAFKIQPEAIYGDYVMLMTGAGNCREDYMELVRVIRRITGDYAIGRHEKKQATVTPKFELEIAKLPTKRELVPLYRSENRVLSDPIITYPPGTPIACPGEVMNIDVLTYITQSVERGEKVIGVDEEGQIYVGI